MRIAAAAGLLVGSLLLVLLALEGALRVLAPPSSLYPFPALYRPSESPEIVYELQPDLDAVGYGAVVRTNALGFRDEPLSLEKPEDVLRVVAAGDSITFGYGVAAEESFPEVLERLLAARCGVRSEVVNAGVMGYTALQSLATLREKGLPLQPDLALFTLVSNDVEPAYAVDAAGFLHHGDERSAHTLARHAPPRRPLPLPFAEALRGGSVLFNFLELRWNRLLTRFGGGPEPPPGFPATPETRQASRYNEGLTARQLLDTWVPTYSFEARAIWSRIELVLAETRAAFAARGVPLVVAVFDAPGLFARRVLELRERHPVPFVLFAYDFGSGARYLREYSLGWDLHPNAAAHARMAERLYAELRRAGLPGAARCAEANAVEDAWPQLAADAQRFEKELARLRAGMTASSLDFEGPRLPRQVVRGVPRLEQLRRLVLLLRRPAQGATELAVRGRVPPEARAAPSAPLLLSARVNGVDLEPLRVGRTGPFSHAFALPESLPRSDLFEIGLRLDRRGDPSHPRRVPELVALRIESVALQNARR